MGIFAHRNQLEEHVLALVRQFDVDACPAWQRVVGSRLHDNVIINNDRQGVRDNDVHSYSQLYVEF